MTDIEIDKLVEKIAVHGNINSEIILMELENSGVLFNKEEIIELYSSLFTSRRFSSTSADIIKLIGLIGKESNPQSVLDICCGTASILSQFEVAQSLTGIDINEDILKLAERFYPNAKIINADIIDFDFQNTVYDLVVGDIPYALPSRTNDPGELLILKKGLTLIKENGTGIFMIPDTILRSSFAREFRSYLLSNFAIDMIISLPEDSYINPNSLKASVIVIRKGLPGNEIFFTEYSSNAEQILSGFKSHTGSFFSKITLLKDRLDYTYYKSESTILEKIKGKETKMLSELAIIIRGQKIYTRSHQLSGEYEIFNPYSKEGKKVYTDNISDDKAILQPGDIIFSLWPHSEFFSVANKNNHKIVVSDWYAIIRSSENPYIRIFLETEDGKKFLYQQINTQCSLSMAIPTRLKLLGKLIVPILPLTELDFSSDEWIRTAEVNELIKAKSQLQTLIRDYEKINASLHTNLAIELLYRIESTLNTVKDKVEDLYDLLKNLSTDIYQIKSSQGSIEDKLLTINIQIDKNIDQIISLRGKTLEAYEKGIENWLIDYSKLHLDSRSFLTSAEYLYDEISRIDISDYSPFIIQYCRAIENEILKKIFEEYHSNLLSCKTDRIMLTQNDRDDGQTG